MVCPTCMGTVRSERVCYGSGNFGIELTCRADDFRVRFPGTDSAEIAEWLADQVSQVIRKNGWGPPGFAFRV